MQLLSACPACGSDRISFAFEGRTTRDPRDAGRWRVERCDDCALGFLNPQPSFEDLRDYYSDDYEAYTYTDNVEQVAAAARSAGEYRFLPIPDGKRVLDVGCASGLHLRVWRNLGATVKGVEPSPVAANTARSHGLDVFNGTLEEFDTDERFDLITMNQVIEHVPDPVSTMTHLKRLLAPGGMAWLSTPNWACPWAAKLGWKWDGADLPYHLLHFGPESMASAADRAGLKIKRLRTYSDPGIVAFSMQKHLRQNWGVPGKVTNLFFTENMARRMGASLDEKDRGDNLLVELVA